MGLAKYRTAVITLSDKGAAGERKDESGLAICERLRQNGQYEIVETLLLPDDCALLKTQLVRICDEKLADLILTTGGTGFSKRDVTPEATLAVAERNAPGIAEYLRYRSMQITPKAMLSRGVSVMRGDTLIVNLPGSTKAVKENLEFLLPALDHGLNIMLGRAGECGGR